MASQGLRRWYLGYLRARVRWGRWCLVHAPAGSRLRWSRALDRWILALYALDPDLQGGARPVPAPAEHHREASAG